MAFGVFIHRSDSIYDDSPAEQYQFPSQYLSRVEACVGDWIVDYEPRKVAETRGYFAIAKVGQIIPDPNISGMYLALIKARSYLDFAHSLSAERPGQSNKGFSTTKDGFPDVLNRRFVRFLLEIFTRSSSSDSQKGCPFCPGVTMICDHPALTRSRRPLSLIKSATASASPYRGLHAIECSVALFCALMMSVVRSRD